MPNAKRKCKHCKEYFAYESMINVGSYVFCSMSHAVEFASIKGKAATKRRIAQAKKRQQEERKQDKLVMKQRKEKLKSLSTICSEAQKHVNAMILAHARAYQLPCIATDRTPEHAGHYIHAGSKYRISWLRFHGGNIHGQNGESNTHKSGDTVNFRMGMVKRYGEQYVKDLEEFKRVEDSGMIPAPTREEIAGMVKWCKSMTAIYKKRAFY